MPLSQPDSPAPSAIGELPQLSPTPGAAASSSITHASPPFAPVVLPPPGQVLAAGTATVANGLALRIMPLGASITYGVGSSSGNGYRRGVRARLEAAGNPVHMVGSHSAGSMRDAANEGWPGFVVDEVRAKAAQYAPAYRPNLVLLNAGTNDCIRGLDLAGAVRERTRALLEAVWTASPRATVVVSTLLVNRSPPTESNVGLYNADLRGLVADLQAQGRRVVLVDMQGNDGPTMDDLVDDTHPGDAGYEKMANVWMKGIRDADARGYLLTAEYVQGIPVDGGD